MPATTPAPGRFYAKVRLNLDTGCWDWTAAKQQGYGTMRGPDRTTVRAHRYAYELLVGPIPDGLHLDHLCRNRGCVNPAHLEPVTSGENTRRSPLHNLAQRSRTHCKNGHEFSEANTRHRNGARLCRACVRESMRRHRARKATA